jgi:hypothetical protein
MGQSHPQVSAWLMWGAVILVAAGCASTPMTPAQQRTWDAFHKCAAFTPTVRLDYIREDGSYHYRYLSEADHNSMRDCMRKEHIEASKAQFTFRFDPALGAFTPPEPRSLVRHAYFTRVQPTGRLTSTSLPPATGSFVMDQPVIFFLALHRSEQVLQGTFKWYRPDGTLDSQQKRTFRTAEGEGEWTWYTQLLPSGRLQTPGTWALETYLNEQLIGRYQFLVNP